eukprot:281640_1
MLVKLMNIFLCMIVCNCTTYEWNIADKYGSITQSTIAHAISDTRNVFEKSPNDIVILIINNGTYNIGGNNNYGIDLTKGMKPGNNGGRFIIRGQGINETILIFTDIYQDQIFGKNVYHTTFENMHITRNKYTVTQGTAQNINIQKQFIDIILHSGFPTPLSLLSPTHEPAGGGLFIRQYTNSITDPHIYVNLSDIPWVNASLIDNTKNIWRLYLNDRNNVLQFYKLNEYIGVKVKHDGNAYHFCVGNDIIFQNIKWTQTTRGILRCGVSNILFENVSVLRSPAINGQMPCMASSAGGPQINDQNDTMAYNASVKDSYFECTGDDSIAFFHVTNGSVYNTYIRDSFSKGIKVNEAANGVCGQNITLVRSILYDDSGTYHNGCS